MSLFEELENFTSNLEEVTTNEGNTGTDEPVKNDGTGYVAKSDKASERFLEKISSLGYNLSELESVLKVNGNQLVNACAGAGKTTATIFKLIYETKTGLLTKKVEVNGQTYRTMSRVWVSTFLRTGAKELEYELSKWNKKLGYVDNAQSINFSTIHAEFKAVLNALGVTTDFIKDKDNTNILKNVIKRYGINKRGRNLNSDDIREFEGALTYTRNRLDADRYTHPLYREWGVSPIEIDSVLSEWAKSRRANGKMDFEDLQDYLYTFLYEEERQEVIDFIANRYDYLFVDEFQDTSQKQYAILKAYMVGAKKIVVVGDDDQTIYSWRGSDNRIITDTFIKDFSPTISNLSYNYRCPSNILNGIIPSIEKNTIRLDKHIQSSREGGELRIGRYPSYNAMVRSLNELVYKDVSEGMSVAIICRENTDGLLPAVMLDRDGRFTFSISGDGMTLNSYMAKQALNIVRLVSEKYSKGVSEALKTLVFFNRYEVDSLISACKNSGDSIWTVGDDELQYSCPNLAPHVLEWRNVYRGIKDGVIDELDMVEYLLGWYITNVYNVKDATYDMRMRSILSSLLVLVRDGGYSNAADFLYELEELNLRLKSREKVNNVDIKIVTVHEFKGKEVDSSYVWNDSFDVFPHKKAITDADLEEERRVHYIACTRGKKRSTIMTMVGLEGMFVREMDLNSALELTTQTTNSTKGKLGSNSNKSEGAIKSEEARNLRHWQEGLI